MRKIYDLTKGVDETQFFYCYGPAVKAYNKFFVEDGNCIRNDFNPELGDFDYTSFISREKYGVGAKIYTEFKFEKRGAPLVVLGDDIRENAAGVPIYGTHFEVIGFEDGCNVWYLIPRPDRPERPVEPVLIGKLRFPIPNMSVVKLTVEILEKGFSIEINGEKLTVTHPSIPAELHVGLTACEGINRFYAFEIET